MKRYLNLLWCVPLPVFLSGVIIYTAGLDVFLILLTILLTFVMTCYGLFKFFD